MVNQLTTAEALMVTYLKGDKSVANLLIDALKDTEEGESHIPVPPLTRLNVTRDRLRVVVCLDPALLDRNIEIDHEQLGQIIDRWLDGRGHLTLIGCTDIRFYELPESFAPRWRDQETYPPGPGGGAGGGDGSGGSSCTSASGERTTQPPRTLIEMGPVVCVEFLPAEDADEEND